MSNLALCGKNPVLVPVGPAVPTFHPIWKGWNGSVTTPYPATAADDAAIQDAGQFNDYLGPSSGHQYMLSMVSGFLWTHFLGLPNEYQMVVAKSKWPAPSVGEHIFYSGLLSLSSPNASGSIHEWQLNDAAGSPVYTWFMHYRNNTPGSPTYRWDIELPLWLDAFSDPERYCVNIPVYPAAYFFNLRMTPTSGSNAKIAARIYNLDNTIYKDTNEFFNNNGDPLGTHNLLLDNPDVAITGPSAYYGAMEIGNNDDSGALSDTFLLSKYASVHITTNGNDWPGARIPV